MPTRTLQTTPALCAGYLEAQTKHGLLNSADAWVVQDAAAAHDLLAIVKTLRGVLAFAMVPEQDRDGFCFECQENVGHGVAHGPDCTFPGRQAALDSGKDWVDEA